MATKNSAKKLLETSNGAEPAGERRRHSLVLQAWEAINSERELEAVLAAVAKVLVPVVPFFAVAVIAPEARQGAPWALHIVDLPGSGDEGVDNVHRRLRGTLAPIAPTPEKKLIPYGDPEHESVKNAVQAYILDDLLKKDACFPHEFKLGVVGIRAYTSIPLQARAKGIGVLVFSRIKPDPFSPDQMTILVDVSRAIAVAVANALANEEIARLRDQLEAENIALRDQLRRSTKFEEMVGD